jgi:hypothetical protein
LQILTAADRLARDGYAPGPSPHVTRVALAIDTEPAAASQCEVCGQAGLDFAPYHKGANYRALMVCPLCGADAEF